jgi:hypothetical protein
VRNRAGPIPLPSRPDNKRVRNRALGASHLKRTRGPTDSFRELTVIFTLKQSAEASQRKR